VRKKNDKRKYIRLTTVLPVACTFFDKDGKQLTPLIQGFTNDVSKGGICLIINDLWKGIGDKIKDADKVGLNIDLFFKRKTLSVSGKPAWRVEKAFATHLQHRVGIEFEGADKKAINNLFNYATLKRLSPVLISGLIIFLLAINASSWLKNQDLKQKNQYILSEYKILVKEQKRVKNNIRIEKESTLGLKEQQKKIIEKIALLQKDLVTTKQENLDGAEGKALEMAKHIESLKNENAFLRSKIVQKESIADRLEVTTQTRHEEIQIVEKKVLDQMYEWIKNRQDLETGLVLSYEGDKSLEKVAFTYDQALAVITFVVFNDLARAEEIINFYYRSYSRKKPIYNGYYTNGDIYEYTEHSGVKAWMGIATLNYIKRTGDKKYLSFVQSLADDIVSVMDEEGGIRGGKNFKWYSTEHNLDAYAFFKLYGELEGNQEYIQISEKIGQWLNRYAYTDKQIPVNRGRGDSVIATDTYAWSITALTPQYLISLGIDPDQIINFAIANCEVETTFFNGSNQINVKGFDFSKFKNLARGGVISCEWTAQMILAFEVMADFYADKDNDKKFDYLKKAEMYSKELKKMIIISPSPSGKSNPVLPYASRADVDTGHGWRTPKGNSIGSLAATSYFLISQKGYNPLTAELLGVSLGKK